MRTRSHEGYLTVDHRASPGIPAALAVQMGMDPRLVGEGGFFESATMTCTHCRGVVILNPQRTRARAYCQKCDHYVCDGCHALTTLPGYQHVPYEQMVGRALDGQAASPPPLTLVVP